MLRRRGGAPRSLQHATGALRYDLVDSLNRFAPTVVVRFGIGTLGAAGNQPAREGGSVNLKS